MNAILLAAPPVSPAVRRNRANKTAPPVPVLASPPAPTDEDHPGPGSAISDKTHIIVARVNVGWGNTLYLRGEGGCLSWDMGVPMICSGDDRWVWSCHGEHAPRQFKFLLNDEIWSEGENQIMSGADITVCNPKFP